MPTINLREHYPDAHPEDFFVEVSEEVHQALAELKRKEDALIRQIYRYHAYHSLDDPHLTLEQSILCPPQNPLDAVEQRHHLRHINDAILIFAPETSSKMLRLLLSGDADAGYS